MKVSNNNGSKTFNGDIINLHNQNWIDNQRVAGKIVANTLNLLENLVKEKTVKSLLELDKIAEEYILSEGGTPTFKGYMGFPNAVCISINQALVHGIPTNYILKEGDCVKFDLGATVEGAIGDSAITVVYGKDKFNHNKGIKITKKCLDEAIKQVSIGKRIGIIGETIYQIAKENGFGVIESHGGHSISYNIPHAPPFISNRSIVSEGVRIQAGMTLAIEPLLIPYNCSNKTKLSNDGWTVYTDQIGYHFENTIFVHPDNTVEIMTDRKSLCI